MRVSVERPGGQVSKYLPPLRLCARSPQVVLKDAENYKLSHAIPLFLAADGPVFTEPGNYRLWVELGRIDGAKAAFADPVNLRVASPDAATDAFATALWEAPELLLPLYLQHPLSDPAAFAGLEEAARRSEEQLEFLYRRM